mgnify:CR=1 FL=1
MKKTILLLLFALITTLSYGQKALFDQYDDTNKVTTVYISHSMMQLMGDVKVDNKDITKIASRLEYLRILSCEHPSLIPNIIRTAQAIYKTQKYNVAMKVNDSGEQVTIYEKIYSNGKREYSLLSIERKEVSIINVMGNITLKDIQSIAH